MDTLFLEYFDAFMTQYTASYSMRQQRPLSLCETSQHI